MSEENSRDQQQYRADRINSLAVPTSLVNTNPVAAISPPSDDTRDRLCAATTRKHSLPVKDEGEM